MSLTQRDYQSMAPIACTSMFMHRDREASRRDLAENKTFITDAGIRKSSSRVHMASSCVQQHPQEEQFPSTGRGLFGYKKPN